MAIIINRIRPLAAKWGLDIKDLSRIFDVAEEQAEKWYNGEEQAPSDYENILLSWESK